MKAFTTISIAIILAICSVEANVLNGNAGSQSNEFCYSLSPQLSSTYSNFLTKYGSNGMAFLICMGPEWIDTCADPTAHCMYTHDNPIECITSKKCLGKDVKPCASNYQLA